MRELGFFMDADGNVTYFGEWVEHPDKNNRRQFHDTSFEDDVMSEEAFQKLNLKYDKDMDFFEKAIAFALQGMVTFQNTTYQGISSFTMCAPEYLTARQKKSFLELYPLLSSFQEAMIVIPKSVSITDDDAIDNVDSYFETYGILPSIIR